MKYDIDRPDERKYILLGSLRDGTTTIQGIVLRGEENIDATVRAVLDEVKRVCPDPKTVVMKFTWEGTQ